MAADYSTIIISANAAFGLLIGGGGIAAVWKRAKIRGYNEMRAFEAADKVLGARGAPGIDERLNILTLEVRDLRAEIRSIKNLLERRHDQLP